MIALDMFCSWQSWHGVLSAPFSIRDLTYAADGIIAVCVPRRPDVPENPDAFSYVKAIEGYFASAPNPAVWTRPRFFLPPRPNEIGKCPSCDGEGVFDCAALDECESCGGTGELSGEFVKSTSIGGVAFNLGYVRRMVSLPDLEIALTARVSEGRVMFPLMFQFTGGSGLLAPLKAPRSQHVEIEEQGR